MLSTNSIGKTFLTLILHTCCRWKSSLRYAPLLHLSLKEKARRAEVSLSCSSRSLIWCYVLRMITHSLPFTRRASAAACSPSICLAIIPFHSQKCTVLENVIWSLYQHVPYDHSTNWLPLLTLKWEKFLPFISNIYIIYYPFFLN